MDLVSGSQIIGSKSINAISFTGERAFLATDFGILDFDTGTAEIRGTYRELGNNAEQLGVSDLDIFADSLFAVTEEGWQVAALDRATLADYRNWRRNGVDDGVQHVTAFDEVIFFQAADTVYSYQNGIFAVLLNSGDYRGLEKYDDDLIVYSTDEIRIMTTEGTTIEVISEDVFTRINEVLVDAGGSFWVADESGGLLREIDNAWQSFSPTGPVRSDMFALESAGNIVSAFSGGFGATVIPFNREGSYSVFEEGLWTNFETTGFDDVSDGVRVGDIRYFASAVDGIMQTNNGEQVVFDENNSPLNPDNSGRVIVVDLSVENDLLYAVNFSSVTPLISFNGSAWTAYSGIPSIGQYSMEAVFQGQVAWLRVNPSRGGGVVGYNLESGEARYINEQPDQGNLASRRVYDLEIDREGFLWFGTERGVSILFNPTSLDGNINAVEPVFDGRPLLVDREVYVIKSDGGNRKWIGTDQGVWLFDELADELISHFTSSNSPLPSDVVRDIAINGESGEVFFLTDTGIASYRAAATNADRSHSDVRIYPNPVRREFQGTVGISGLASDAIIKITDVSGRLVFQTRANGGTAAWPIRQTPGLNTGMYIVFSASSDGEERYIGKIAVIN